MWLEVDFGFWLLMVMFDWILLNLLDNVYVYGVLLVFVEMVCVLIGYVLLVSDSGGGIVLCDFVVVMWLFVWFDLVCGGNGYSGFGFVIVEWLVFRLGGVCDIGNCFEGGLWVLMMFLFEVVLKDEFYVEVV